ncbi:MAG: helix-turn-helix domain-containing protein, partial [Oscillospiraceae bacterium]|nr:helix-turn-helix domain-containing protein [Oscillospiraceae bacterium]
MSTSDKVKGLLALRGKNQLELADHFDMSKQTMSNNMERGSWSAD